MDVVANSAEALRVRPRGDAAYRLIRATATVEPYQGMSAALPKGIGHEQVPHGDHVDYLVDGRLHHPHDDHCDDHGPVALG
jgi:hypothetical protein